MIVRLTRLSTLSALSAALLLGACSNKNKTAAEAATAEAQAQAGANEGGEANAAEETVAEAPAPNYWPVAAPLLAGTYKSQCMQPPDMKVVEVAFTLGTDGKLSGPGIEGNYGKHPHIRLSRDVKARSAWLSLDAGSDSQALQLFAGPDPDAAKAVLPGQAYIDCKKLSGTDALTDKPLHTTFAKMMATSGRKVTCVQLANMLNQQDMTLQVAGTTVTLGAQKFELDKVEAETINFSDGPNGFDYAFQLPGTEQMGLMYSAEGKLAAMTGVFIDGKKNMCSVRDEE